MSVRFHERMAALVFAGLCGQPLAAQNLRSSISVSTDYIHRGVSQTDGDPALQASVAYWNATGWYVGAWGSNVETARRYFPATASSIEVNTFLGFSHRIGPDWVVDAQVIRYLYPGDRAPVSYDYTEFGVNIAFRERYYASIMVSPDTTIRGQYEFGRRQTAYNYEVSLQQPLSSWLTASLGAGYYDLSDLFGTGYLFGGASLAMQVGRVMMVLGHYATDDTAQDIFGAHLAANRTVLTTTFSF